VADIVKDSELEQVLIELFCLDENFANPDEAGIAAPETRSRFCEMAFPCGIMLLFSADSHLVRSYPAGGELKRKSDGPGSSRVSDPNTSSSPRDNSASPSQRPQRVRTRCRCFHLASYGCACTGIARATMPNTRLTAKAVAELLHSVNSSLERMEPFPSYRASDSPCGVSVGM